MRGPLSTQKGSVATATGGITFQKLPTADPANELEVLKTILLREGYLQRILQMTQRPNFTVNSEIVDLIDLTRLCTVEVVEAIVKWRRGMVRKEGTHAPHNRLHTHTQHSLTPCPLLFQLKPYPFMWNGLNYMQKLACDMDFLDLVTPLRQWLGFSMIHNPFIIPVKASDARALTSGSIVVGGGGGGGGRANKSRAGTQESTFGQELPPGAYGASSTSFTEIGGRSTLETQPSRGGGGGGGGRGGGLGATGGSSVRGPRHPYQTAVINDAGLHPMGRGTAGSRSVTIGARMELPSHIGDLDMIRVREAEKVIDMEESIHGRFIMDPFGRLVPELRPLDADVVAAREGRQTSSDGHGRRPSSAGMPSRGGGTGSQRDPFGLERPSSTTADGHMPRRLAPMTAGTDMSSYDERGGTAGSRLGTASDGWRLDGFGGGGGSSGNLVGGGGGGVGTGTSLGDTSGSLGQFGTGTASFVEGEGGDVPGQPRGRHAAKKKGGILTPLTKQATRGAPAKPATHQTRAARVDHEITKARDETRRLAQELARLKNELADEEARIAAEEAEFATRGDVSADTAPPGPGTVEQQHIDHDKAVVQGKRNAVAAQEQELAKREEMLQRKEEHRDRLRQVSVCVMHVV